MSRTWRLPVAGWLRQALAWLLAYGVTVQRALADNGSCHRILRWKADCDKAGIVVDDNRAQTNPHRALLTDSATPGPTPPQAAALDPGSPGGMGVVILRRMRPG